jgi:transcriptional regulator with XRE-family HTH domain
MLSKTIGSKLLELRKQKNWSQEKTADHLSISRPVYQRIETGEGYS